MVVYREINRVSDSYVSNI